MSDEATTFVSCIGIGDPEVVAEIIEMLLDRGSLTARQIAEELGVSYPLVLRVINILYNRGLVKTSKLKGERGRPRKLIMLNKEKVIEMVDNCIKSLQRFREIVEKAPEPKHGVEGTYEA
ncbi:helix-turn-helix domain-containing protein [Stetteria hydrogenophila]